MAAQRPIRVRTHPSVLADPRCHGLLIRLAFHASRHGVAWISTSDRQLTRVADLISRDEPAGLACDFSSRVTCEDPSCAVHRDVFQMRTVFATNGLLSNNPRRVLLPTGCTGSEDDLLATEEAIQYRDKLIVTCDASTLPAQVLSEHRIKSISVGNFLREFYRGFPNIMERTLAEHQHETGMGDHMFKNYLKEAILERV